ALPVTEAYHSTRQLIGRLECRPQRQFRIRYDLLDGNDLSFDQDDEENIPYVNNPFMPHPPIPQGGFDGPMKQLRPYLLWAALNFAAADDQGRERAVLVSITERISEYAEDFLTLLHAWSDQQLPNHF